MTSVQFWRWSGWGLMTFLALSITIVVSRYFTFDSAVYFPEQLSIYTRYTLPLMVHITGGILALASGPFQFLPRLRTKYPSIHRWVGRLYLVGILLGGTGGFFMAFHAWTGWRAGLSFGILAILWLLTGWMAYRTIRQGNVQAHRRWMIRNYALTFAAVQQRLLTSLLLFGFGMASADAYIIVAWLMWVPNLLVVEGCMRWSQSSFSNKTYPQPKPAL